MWLLSHHVIIHHSFIHSKVLQIAVCHGIVRENFSRFFFKIQKRDFLRFLEVTCQKNIENSYPNYPTFRIVNLLTFQCGYMDHVIR